jgi:hypothetical protein
MNEDAYGYANALQNSISAHQEAIQTASEDLMKNAQDLPNKIKEVGIGIGSKILTDATNKLVTQTVSSVQKAISQGVTKASQAVTKVLQQTGLDQEEGDAGDEADETGAGDTDNVITANEQNPLFDPDADVEPPAFEEAPQLPEYTPATFEAPSNEAISQAGQVEEGLIPQTEEFDYNVPFPEVEPGYADFMASQGAGLAEEDANIGTDLVQSNLNTITDLAQSPLNNLVSDASNVLDDTVSTVANVGSKIASDVGTVATAVDDGVSTGLEATGVALDSTGIGSVVGVLLGIGGILASIFAPSDDSEPTLPPPPNFSYQTGA